MLFRVLDFFEELQEQAGKIPVDFSNVATLRPHWKKFVEAREEGQVIRAEEEESASA